MNTKVQSSAKTDMISSLRTATRVLNTVMKTHVNTAVSTKVQSSAKTDMISSLTTSTRVLNSHEDPGEHSCEHEGAALQPQNINQVLNSHEDPGEHSCEHQGGALHRQT